MCGIVAVVGHDDAVSAAFNGLKAIGYRGYDSHGYSFLVNEKIDYMKFIGPPKFVPGYQSDVCIAHVRWATNGANTVENCQPHLSKAKNLAVVHNGIITNAEDIKKTFNLQTTGESDSEILAELISHYYRKPGHPLTYFACKNAAYELSGDNAFVVLFDNGQVIAYSKNMSLVYGYVGETLYIVSDPIAFPPEVTRYCIIEGTEVSFFHERCTIPVSNNDDVSKKIEQYWTLSEIKEQPTAISVVPELKNQLNDPVYLIGSGSSYNAALFGTHFIGNSRAFLPHEIMNQPIPPGKCIFLSQSGESKDILDAARHLKSQGMSLEDFAITNNINSTLARLCNNTIHLDCGPEIGVAATKSFTAQLQVLSALAGISLINTPLFSKPVKYKFENPNDLAVRQVIEKNILYILGSGPNYALAREAALKIQELSYIPAQAFYTHEFKHGPLALIETNTPVLFIDDEIEPTYSQISARGGSVWCAGQNSDVIQKCIDIQLLAYHLAVAKNLDPDKPRNLAKSVTV